MGLFDFFKPAVSASIHFKPRRGHRNKQYYGMPQQPHQHQHQVRSNSQQHQDSNLNSQISKIMGL